MSLSGPALTGILAENRREIIQWLLNRKWHAPDISCHGGWRRCRHQITKVKEVNASMKLTYSVKVMGCLNTTERLDLIWFIFSWAAQKSCWWWTEHSTPWRHSISKITVKITVNTNISGHRTEITVGLACCFGILVARPISFYKWL